MLGSAKDTAAADGGESKSALIRKSLSDKGWAEKQAAGFTTWLNFTLGGAEKPLKEGGDGDNGENDDVGGDGGAGAGGGGISSSPLKAMVAMVSLCVCMCFLLSSPWSYYDGFNQPFRAIHLTILASALTHSHTNTLFFSFFLSCTVFRLHHSTLHDTSLSLDAFALVFFLRFTITLHCTNATAPRGKKAHEGNVPVRLAGGTRAVGRRYPEGGRGHDFVEERPRAARRRRTERCTHRPGK